MQVDLANISPRESYFYLISAITPRPIAWVSTCSNSGVDNLAPFSFFNGVCAHPPTLAFSPVNRPNGTQKDTVNNIRENGEFVVNVVSEGLAEKMNVSAAEFPFDQSEFAMARIPQINSVKIKAKRVKESPIQFECRLNQIVNIGEGAYAANLIIGNIVLMHIADEIINEQNRIDTDKVKSIGRMGGSDYCRTQDRFTMKIPDVERI